MQLYLIRHGQSANNALGATGAEEFERKRHHDPALTETGHEQAADLAQYIAANEIEPSSRIVFDRLYTSAMRRALETTRPLADALHITPQVWLDIHEMGGMYLSGQNGQATGYPGITRAEFGAQYPDWTPPTGLTDAGWWSPDRGEETLEEANARARRVATTLHALAAELPDANIALVSHGVFLDRLIRALMDLPMPSLEQRRLIYAHNNTGLSKISFMQEWGTLVQYLNRVEHLPATLHTW